MACTVADRDLSASMVNSSAMRRVSDSKRPPSCREATSVTTPYVRTVPAFGTSVSTTTRSSSCRKLVSSMRIRNSVVVAGSRPSTSPTCSSSSSNTGVLRGTGEGGADATEHQLPVALEMPQPALEGRDGDEVLGRAGVPERLRGEGREVGRGEIGELDRSRQGQGGAPPAPG